MIKLLVFDWDDVLALGAKEAYDQCYIYSVRAIGLNMPDQEVAKTVQGFWGRPHREVLAEILTTHQARGQLEQANAAYLRFLFSDQFTHRLRLAPGSLDMLYRLKQSYQLAVATSANIKLVSTRLMPVFGLSQMFDQVVTYADLPDPTRTKPYPDLLRLVMRRCDADSSQTIMVGDSEADVAMAITAGCLPVAVLTGRLDEATARRLGVTHTIPTVTDLPRVLDELS